MTRKKLFTITLVLSVFVFTFVPAGTAPYMADASEAYQNVENNSGIITANEVNLRTGPATTFDIICKLKKDQKVTVMGKLGDWYAIYAGGSGNVGSVSSRYLKLDKIKNASTTKQTTTAKPDKNTANTVEKKNTQTGSKTPASNAKTGTNAASTAIEQIKDISADEQSLLDMVNKFRKEQGLKALQFDAQLVKIARLKAKDMKENNYFSHTSKYYGTPFDMMKKNGVKFSTAGENIAGNQSVEKVVKAWVKENSNNIYNDKFTYTGIGIVDSPTYGKLFVQLFIKK
ncbi:MAG: putative protein with domain [Eubacterium sp.]|jgi:uncharacterized protein YkwD|nr:putative protein with domain [Eubacterium sp.]